MPTTVPALVCLGAAPLTYASNKKGIADMNRWKLMAMTAVSAAVVSLAACSSTTPSSNNSSATPSTSTRPSMNASSLNKTLQAFHWDLVSAQDQAGRALPAFTALAPKNAVRLGFVGTDKPGDQRIVTKVCNTMGGGYQLDGNTISVGNLMSTKMACADNALMQLEQAVGAQLGRAQQVHLAQDANPPRMTLQFNDGSRWQLVGTPTDTTQYGNAGETIFLEVAAHTVPCNHPLMRDAQCLQVRNLIYDAGGLKKGVGNWEVFSSPIKGYTHEKGVRNVLRLKRYTVQNPPADASRYAYVHDLTVESETVK